MCYRLEINAVARSRTSNLSLGVEVEGKKINNDEVEARRVRGLDAEAVDVVMFCSSGEGVKK
jgi:hypothetical protein